ncbi:hypothetical protein MKZ38_006973 [Zalerion maritima]|uniref:Uncharacterized protein n=1 Tax=Zalerion maritima TaxID=339359 RepID=A0AAD5RIC2_9PEZI|nr:hypothetical protein MKZ38_006973 [Zalerion maritima]
MGGLKDSVWATANRPPSVPPPKRTPEKLGCWHARTELKITSTTSLPIRGSSPQSLDSNNRPAPPQATPASAATTTTITAAALLPSTLPATAQKPAQELNRYSKIVRRLKWKLPYLADGYHAATSQTMAPELRTEAELMFKLDFYEYYMLLERALVHLLGVYDIRVSSRRGVSGIANITAAEKGGVGNDNGNGAGGSSSTAAAASDMVGGEGGTTHRYHANVLAALNQEENPLHTVLGQGETRRLLGRAKDLRNRWKYAEEDEADGVGAQSQLSQAAINGLGASRHAMGPRKRFGSEALIMYDVENMLLHIFIAFDAASNVANEYVSGLAATAPTGGVGRGHGNFNRAMGQNSGPTGTDWSAKDMTENEDEHWGFMVDAMDWEAV